MKCHVQVLDELVVQQRLVPVLEDKLGHANLVRVRELLPLFAGGKASLKDCLRLFCSYQDPANQSAVVSSLARFRVFRKSVNDILKAADVHAQLSVDTKKRDAPEDRLCWFEGDVALATQKGEYVETNGVFVAIGLPGPHDPQAFLTEVRKHGRGFRPADLVELKSFIADSDPGLDLRNRWSIGTLHPKVGAFYPRALPGTRPYQPEPRMMVPTNFMMVFVRASIQRPVFTRKA